MEFGMAESSATEKIYLQEDQKKSAPLLSPNSPEGIAELRNYVAATLNLNHDLNNPLAGIMGFLELALGHKDEMEPKVFELLELVKKSAVKLNERLLKFTEEKRRMKSKVDISALEESKTVS